MKKKKIIPPADIILDVINEDTYAEEILKFYDKYIISVAKETLYDAEGNYKGVCINEDLAQEIRIAVLNSLPSLRKAFQKKFLRKTPVIILITKETT